MVGERIGRSGNPEADRKGVVAAYRGSAGDGDELVTPFMSRIGTVLQDANGAGLIKKQGDAT